MSDDTKVTVQYGFKVLRHEPIAFIKPWTWQDNLRAFIGRAWFALVQIFLYAVMFLSFAFVVSRLK